MATSQWARVVDALVDTMRAQSGYRTPGADADADHVLVVDGIEIVHTEDNAARYLVIGGTYEDEEAPGVVGQAVATLGTNRSRDENGTVLCTAAAWSGDVVLPDASVAVASEAKTARQLRADAFGILAGVESVLRANPTLGLVGGGVQHMNVEIGDRTSVSQVVNDDGVACVVTFAVAFTARI